MTWAIWWCWSRSTMPSWPPRSAGSISAARQWPWWTAMISGSSRVWIRSLLIPGTSGDWSDTYVITSQSLPATRAPTPTCSSRPLCRTSVEKMSRHVRILERRQRFIAAGVFVSVFTAVIYLVSSRLNKVLKRMTRFSQRALGIAEPGFNRGGNQLVLLEDWIQHFTQLVLTAREEMSRKPPGRDARERGAQGGHDGGLAGRHRDPGPRGAGHRVQPGGRAPLRGRPALRHRRRLHRPLPA